MSSTDLILGALSPPRYGSIYLIGGGGKTTLLYGLAARLAAPERRVITTTSTRIEVPSRSRADRLEICERVPLLLERLKRSTWSHATVARAVQRSSSLPIGEESSEALPSSGPRDKLVGYSIEELDELQGSRAAAALLVEADGAAGRSLKAHAAHEPVVSARADIVVVVVGMDCIGRPLCADFVHRADLFAERLSMEKGTPIVPSHVARIILHPKGYLCGIAESTRVIVAITKARAREGILAADQVKRELRDMDKAGRIERVLSIGRRDLTSAS